VSRLTLAPTLLPRAASAINLSALLTGTTLGANTGVTWSNSGKEVLAVQVGASTTTCSITVGTTVEGQQPPPLTPVLAASGINLLGPFPSDLEVTGMLLVDFGTPANVTGICLVQYVGVL
jgi:hypothetical protein